MTGHNSYDLHRRFWDWSFRHQDQRTPSHIALYCWLVECCNRYKWPDSFEMAPQYGMAAIGVSSYNTYKKVYEELEAFGFIRTVRKGKNQYAPWLVALSKFDEALNENPGCAVSRGLSKNDTALDEAPVNGLSRGPSNFDEATPDSVSRGLSNFDKPREIITKNNTKPNQNQTHSRPTAGDETVESKKNDEGEQAFGLVTSFEASPVQPHPPSAAPLPDWTPVTGRVSLEEGEEIDRFIQKLANNRRLIESLSRLNQLRGEQALEWIGKFVVKQWSANNLVDRTEKDLMLHCQSWIEQQQAKQQRHEQRPSPANNRTRQPATQTGSELDDLAAKYFGA